MRYYLPPDIAQQAANDLETMPERIGASADVAFGYLLMLMTLRYTVENDPDADRKLHASNSFEQTEALIHEITHGPLGRAATRVLIRRRGELAATTHPWLVHELHVRNATDARAIGEATMTVLNRWVNREWDGLTTQITAELRSDYGD
jgi:hypothetical protein